MSDVFPPGWTKTVRDLFAEPSRTIGADELEWARAYERSLLQSWARFPRNGEVFEAIEETAVEFVTHWSAPFTGGGSGVLPRGTKVRVEVFDRDPEPIAVYARPLDYAALEATLVSQLDRSADKYDGYSLSLRTEQLNRLFRPVRADSRGAA